MALPAPSRPASVLSFDFDGTLHDPAAVPPVPTAVFALIRQLRTTHHAVWGINTGRSLAQMLDGFSESRFPFLPDWLVTREREIYFPNKSGQWQPHAPWNNHCAGEIHKLFHNSRKLLAHIRHEIEQHTAANWLEIADEPAGVIARSEEEMAWIVAHITPLVATDPGLAWQRNSIYLRFGHRAFHKGSSLSEIARLYQLPAAACFAMGDSHNDLEMLDPAHAGMTACPANAVAEVIAHVTTTGGLITRTVHGAGAIDALDHYFPR